jgi:hypothetical protein
MLRLGVHAGLIVLLTLLTQVGGAVYGLALWLRPRFAWAATSLGFASLFVALYAVTWFPIGQLAALGGRKPLPCIERAGLSASLVSCALHRNYVAPQLFDVIASLSADVAQRYRQDGALDASSRSSMACRCRRIFRTTMVRRLISLSTTRGGEPAPGALASPIG